MADITSCLPFSVKNDDEFLCPHVWGAESLAMAKRSNP